MAPAPAAANENFADEPPFGGELPPPLVKPPSERRPPAGFELSGRRGDPDRRRRRGGARRARREPRDAADRLRARRRLAGELLHRVSGQPHRGRPGGRRRPDRPSAGRVARPAAGRSARPRLLGRDRPEGERPVRLAAALPAVHRAVLRSRGAPSASFTSTCSCCSGSASRCCFFNRGEITTSVPLTYPVLGYVFARMLWVGHPPAGSRRAADPGARRSGGSAIGALALACGRIALNVADSHVIDIGVAGVVGADHITHGQELYNGDFAPGRRNPRRRLRAVQLHRLRAVRGGLPLARSLGRRAGGARGGDRLRPADRARPAGARPATASRPGRSRARDRARLRLARLPVHALHDERERERLADRGDGGRGDAGA